MKHCIDSEGGGPSVSLSGSSSSGPTKTAEQEPARERELEQQLREENEEDDDDDDEEGEESEPEIWDNKCPIEDKLDRHVVDFPWPFWCTECGGADEQSPKQGKCKGVSKHQTVHFLFLFV